MELRQGRKPRQTDVILEDDTEARLFADIGLGLLSVKGLKLAFKVMKAQNDNEWPVEVTVTKRRLRHVAYRMIDKASDLGAMQKHPGIGTDEYPDAVENEFALRNMAADIDE